MTRESGPFEVTTEEVGDGYVIHPKGDIDLSRSPELRVAIAEAQKDGPDRMVVDLSDVPYMDSSGVATLVEAMQIARRAGTKLVLCGLGEKVLAIFQIARLDTVFTIVEDTDEALAV